MTSIHSKSVRIVITAAIAAAAAENRQENAAIEQQAVNYRRAISACLDARGYSVK